MDSDSPPLPPELPRAPLEPLFHSFFEEGPFRSCQVCGKSLADRLYMIQKSWVGSEVIFEAAVCHGCSEALHEELSVESRRRIRRFFLDRRQYWDVLDRCHFCGEARTEQDEFVIAAACHGGDRLGGDSPVSLCGRCEMAMQELLSPETRREMDGFLGRHFDCPPRLGHPLPTEPLVFF